jgi:hypothetical protein
MLMPSLYYTNKILLDQVSDLIQVPRRKPVVDGHDQRFKPELTQTIVPLHMRVLGLVAVETVEEQPIRSGEILDGRHPRLKQYHCS